MILASLGVVAQGACGGRAMPGSTGIDSDDAGGAAGNAGSAGTAEIATAGTGGSRVVNVGGSAGHDTGASAGAAGAGDFQTGGSAGAAGAAGAGTDDGYFTACESPVEQLGGAQVCASGLKHRPIAGECPNQLPRPRALDPEMASEFEMRAAAEGFDADEIDAMYPCREDTDCTERSGGFCSFTGFPYDWYGQAFTRCEYACTSDADCGGGTLCSCGAPAGRCVTAECFTNADCAPGRRCLEYSVDAACGTSTQTAWACETELDECLMDADCPAGDSCTYFSSEGARYCVGCPAPGRPFSVGDDTRRAAQAERGDWYAAALRASANPAPAQLEPELAAALCRAWTQIGLMEHASVASFARFSLELLAAGAPPELLDEAARAMQDEIRHAQLCFALARRHGQNDIGPGCLDVDDALPPFDFEQIVLRAVREGCIGETLSAFEAAEAAEACQDPVSRAALDGIARDEARHAALSWRFVAWALSRAPRALALRVAQIFAAESQRARNPAPPASQPLAAALRAHGIVSAAERPLLHARAFADIIDLSAAQLCAPQRARNQPSASFWPA